MRAAGSRARWLRAAFAAFVIPLIACELPYSVPGILAMRRAPAALLLVLLLSACGRDAPGPRGGSLEIVVDTTGGVERVRVRGEPPAWTLERVLTIGSLDEGHSAFGRVISVMADGEGLIYVADAQASEIRVFDESGTYVRTLGRRGSGPGEFRNLYAIAWLSDTIAVLDPGNARIELLQRDGSAAGTLPHQPLTGPHLHLHRSGPAEFVARAVRPGERGLSGIFVRYTSAGPTDTIAAPPVPQQNTSAIVCRAPESISVFGVPFHSRQLHTFLSRARMVGGMTGEYRIALVAPGGDTLRVIERESPPVPVSDSAWNAGMEEYRTFRERNSGASCEPSDPTRPATQPAWTSLFVDHDGRLWVRATRESGPVFEVFDEAGRLLGGVPVPERMRGTLPYFRNGKLYVVEADELDVQRVAVYKVREAS